MTASDLSIYFNTYTWCWIKSEAEFWIVHYYVTGDTHSKTRMHKFILTYKRWLFIINPANGTFEGNNWATTLYTFSAKIIQVKKSSLNQQLALIVCTGTALSSHLNLANGKIMDQIKQFCQQQWNNTFPSTFIPFESS